MEIKTLRDLKQALKDIPDEVLANFGAGVFEDEFIELLCFKIDDLGDEDISSTYYAEQIEKFPQLSDIGNYIKAIAISQSKYCEDEFWDSDDLIGSDLAIEEKVVEKP